jgi:hypothetical protein
LLIRNALAKLFCSYFPMIGESLKTIREFSKNAAKTTELGI